jgi:hypothetical protein
VTPLLSALTRFGGDEPGAVRSLRHELVSREPWKRGSGGVSGRARQLSERPISPASASTQVRLQGLGRDANGVQDADVREGSSRAELVDSRLADA